jgi:hypothetical protein
MPFVRQEQLDSAAQALKSHLELRASIDEAARCHSEQASQLTGLYEEVDKLAKGRSTVPTSDLFVELVNNLIADAKTLVFRDTYLDRLKELVPAGNNPSYPDILIKLRTLVQILERFQAMLKAESAKHSSIVLELRIILAALELAKLDEEGASDDIAEDEVEYDDEREDEDEDEIEGEGEGEEEDEQLEDDDSRVSDEYVNKNRVKARLGVDVSSLESLLGQEARKPYDRWFHRVEGEEYFNFARLDRLGLPEYLPPAAGITFEKPGK